MKHSFPRRKRRAACRRRRAVQPALEPLEDRLAPAGAPVVAADSSLVNAAGLVKAPPALPVAPAPGPVGQPAAARDEVFFNAILNLGGGRREDPMPHFPASGGGHEEDKRLEVGLARPGEEMQEDVFANDLKDVHPSAVHCEEADTALTLAAEALLVAA
jgi:hypothetical protein